jgi:hypothetical protein
MTQRTEILLARFPAERHSPVEWLSAGLSVYGVVSALPLLRPGSSRSHLGHRLQQRQLVEYLPGSSNHAG